MKEKRTTILIGIFFLLISIVLFISATSIPVPNALAIGGDFMPKVMAVLLIICAIGFVVVGIAQKPTQVPENNPSKKEQRMDAKRWSLFAIEFALLFIYLYLLIPVGFILMTSIYIFVQAWVITVKEERSLIKMAIIAIIASVIIYFIFVKGFHLMLPAGLLG